MKIGGTTFDEDIHETGNMINKYSVSTEWGELRLKQLQANI